MSTHQRELDIVLVGATGFVGRLTAVHLADHAPDGTRIALAGRNPDKLERTRATLGPEAASWPLITLDTMDAGQCREVAERTAVVCTTVGPYAKYGRELVGACAAAGTHYCDLTGEVLFVRDTIDAWHETARATRARIVTSCGFDSVPSDLGVLLLAERVRADGAGTLGETTLHVRTLRGGVSGGTVDSMRQQAIETGSDPARKKVVTDGHGLSPNRSEEPPSRNRHPRPTSWPGRLAAALPARQDRVTGRWVAPFFMASFNTRIVRRSNALTEWSYGRDFRYDEVMDTGRGVAGAAKAGLTTAVLAGLFAGMSIRPTRALLDRVLPSPGEGPSEESMRRGRFVVEIESTTTSGVPYRSRVAAPYDPGYTGTAVMLGESALCLALDDDLPDRAGVLTPATAMGEALIERLRANRFTLEAGPA